MRMWIEENGLEKILFIEPDDPREESTLIEFCRVNDPLTAKLVKCPAYISPHIEIKKES